VSAPPLVSIAVGVVVERRKAQSPWTDFTWAPVAALAGLPEAAPWTKLTEADDRATYYAGPAAIGLYPAETANYRDNLATGAPQIWVALRATGSEPPWDVYAVTADPAEGEGFTVSGSDIVDVVPMPDAIRERIESFVAEHHVEQPFYKRKIDRADPEALGRRGPARKPQQ
jgi:hypothetical protein